VPTQDLHEQLLTEVASILDENRRLKFAEYWSIGKELIAQLPVQSFYARVVGVYVNLVVLASRLVIDIETNENDENPGVFAVTVINSVVKLHFRAGPVQTIPDSEKSQLTVVLSVSDTDVSSYWIAETDAERECLTRFGQYLMQAINES